MSSGSRRGFGPDGSRAPESDIAGGAEATRAFGRPRADPPRASDQEHAAVPSRGAAGDRLRIAGRRVSAVLAGVTVLAQIAYPLSTGESLRLLTIATVLLFAAASVVHAASTRGIRAALVLLVVAGGIGLLAEAVGVRSGVPFGEYAYADSLGPKVLDVPVIVPLAWLMMAYPCLLLGRRLARWRAQVGTARRVRKPSTSRAAAKRRTAAQITGASRRRTGHPGMGPVAILAGGLTLASWDLFLDPQMVAAGHWSWAHPTPALPGVPGVPLTNYAGWVVVALVLMAALHYTFPDVPRATEDVPGAMLAWTWVGSTLGNALFFDRPLVAIWGGVLMGLLVVPYLLSWWDDRP